ncbi:sugar kinase [Novosphingobium sp. FSY-8]|uniref:Sugar kinase n=1 Tax=Novosphingobium ovatum TaxID=1908523 RepID=A0ABW9X976_9SPHN|nr:sugar kinase [Novosphingobium ovatum]NBC35084.1 sugar kinase [Novosphingobium ovatum]
MTGTIVCFGEPLLRLTTPVGQMLTQASALDITVGGAEANVAVALRAMGHGARYVSALPANALGDKVLGALAGAGVDTGHCLRAPGRMGLYFLEAGASLRPSAVTYDRDGSAFATADAGAFDFASALQGARLLHLSGITAALGPNGVALARAAIAAARAADVPISFDCNYRERLWSAWDSQPRAILMELLQHATIMFGNHRDMTLLLQKPFSGDGPERRHEAAQAAFATFPRLQVVASTARTPMTQTHHRLSARVDRRGDHHQTADIAITDIIDRVGSGDAFAAGVLTGWLEGGDAAQMARLGLAMNALKHSQHGDWLRVTRADVLAFDGDGGGDVRR